MASKKILIITFLLFSFIQTIYSQDELQIRPEDDIQSIKKRGYSVDACYRMAEDFLRSNTDQIKAIPYLEFIIETDRYVKPQAFYMLSQAYYYHGKFDRAIKAITEYIGKEQNNQLVKDAKLELERYKNAERIASSPLNASLINLGPEINSKYADINPYISAYENLMVYSSNRSQSFNIYVCKKDFLTTVWSKPKLAGNYVNSVNDEFVAGLSPSGKNLFIHYNQLSGFEDINLSVREKGVYRELGDPGVKVNSTYREEGAYMTENEDTLFFASDRPGGFGGFDLYYSLKLPDGSFGPPINLGETINTKFDENYPNLSPDGKKLYFASKGHNSIGGYDVYYTNFGQDIDKLGIPINLGFPINNAYDNKSITFAQDPRYAYISSIDWRTNGDYDIYKVVFLDVMPNYLIVQAEVFVASEGEPSRFSNENEQLEISVYKGEDVYGKYSYDKRNNSFVMALVPGSYILEIESDKFKSYRKKITISENYYKNNIRVLKINLNKKL